jgi:hypothetical protein
MSFLSGRNTFSAKAKLPPRLVEQNLNFVFIFPFFRAKSRRFSLNMPPKDCSKPSKKNEMKKKDKVIEVRRLLVVFKKKYLHFFMTHVNLILGQDFWFEKQKG